MSKQMPAPWHVEPNSQEDRTKEGFFVCHQDTACEDTVVCWVEEKEDAHLIAAAHDMLEALEWFMGDQPCGSDGELIQKMGVKAAAAIAKATAKGESA